MNTNRHSWIDRPAASAARALCFAALLLTSASCSKGPARPDNMPDLTPCTITVIYSGQPVEGADVLLAPKSGQFSAAGITDAAGRAIMKTDGTYEGGVPGEYLASVTKLEKTAADLGPSPEDPKEYAKMQEKIKALPAPKHLVPEKYSSFTTSGLAVAVTGGTPVEVTLELTD